jgi:hypothetical protein
MDLCLPPFGRFVLVHLVDMPWADKDQEGVMFDVARRVECAVEGNNRVPYAWETWGPSKYFGHEVDMWCELPRSFFDIVVWKPVVFRPVDYKL